jgi:hypothetical protein
VFLHPFLQRLELRFQCRKTLLESIYRRVLEDVQTPEQAEEPKLIPEGRKSIDVFPRESNRFPWPAQTNTRKTSSELPTARLSTWKLLRWRTNSSFWRERRKLRAELDVLPRCNGGKGCRPHPPPPLVDSSSGQRKSDVESPPSQSG